MDDNLSRFVPNVYFEQIPIKNLVSNQDYQRNLSETNILKAAEDFDLFQINPVKVSRRDGINYVFNGQHTIEIVALVSGSRDTPVWCMIYDDLHYEHEAEIFANQMKHVKPLTPFEIFTAHIEAGSTKHLMIKKLVESYRMEISYKKMPGTITAVSTLEKIFDYHGYANLDRTLRLIIGTWEGDVNSFSGSIMFAVSKLIACYGENLHDDVFRDKLGIVSIKALTRQGQDRGHGIKGYAEAMLERYNSKRRRGLPEEALIQAFKVKYMGDEYECAEEVDINDSDM